MSNSTYYKELYKSNKKKARKYKDDLKDLEKIYSDLVDEMGDEIDRINKELDELKSDLSESVRHNSSFSSSIHTIMTNREKSVTSDSKLSSAVESLEDEISRLKAKKEEAEEKEAEYEEKYKEAKNKDLKEAISSIFDWGD